MCCSGCANRSARLRSRALPAGGARNWWRTSPMPDHRRIGLPVCTACVPWAGTVNPGSNRALVCRRSARAAATPGPRATPAAARAACRTPGHRRCGLSIPPGGHRCRSAAHPGANRRPAESCGRRAVGVAHVTLRPSLPSVRSGEFVHNGASHSPMVISSARGWP